MILTRDNLLRFVREKKYVIPTNIAQSFDTTTMIASAALSELAKEKLVLISNLKIGSSPYYYDPAQKEILVELGEKHFSKYDKEVFIKLKNTQVLNHNSLSIQERLAIERLKDFAKEILISYQGNSLKFWVWYLRDLNETKKQIIEALNPKKTEVKKSILKENLTNDSKQNQQKNLNQYKPKQIITEDFENKVDVFIRKYFEENYQKIIEKEQKKNGIFYKTKILINNIEVIFDCFYFEKKPKEIEIIKFFSSSQNPKIIFAQNISKKIFKLAEDLENLSIVNI